MSIIYIGLGTNLGNREANLELAIKLLAPEIRLRKVAPTYETEPMYRLGQPRFMNTVVSAETDLSPEEVLTKFKAVEKSMGRQKGERNGPRVIDLDILFYDDLVMDTPMLTIPHARMHERAFVLAPLSRIAGGMMHPRLKKTINQLKSELGDFSEKIVKIDQSV